MNAYALAVLALAMSMDSFTVALAKGAAVRLNPGQIVKNALTFGMMEMLMPILGWLGGTAARPFIEQWDHWLAFVLLGILGIRMILGEKNDKPERSANHWGLMWTTALATSIDSMVVGVGLAFLDVSIAAAALSIGTATVLMSAIGMYLGQFAAKRAGRYAEISGGLVLIGIGIYTLCKHMNWFQAA